MESTKRLRAMSASGRMEQDILIAKRPSGPCRTAAADSHANIWIARRTLELAARPRTADSSADFRSGRALPDAMRRAYHGDQPRGMMFIAWILLRYLLIKRWTKSPIIRLGFPLPRVMTRANNRFVFASHSRLIAPRLSGSVL
jgi:hypothetical protein